MPACDSTVFGETKGVQPNLVIVSATPTSASMSISVLNLPRKSMLLTIAMPDGTTTNVPAGLFPNNDLDISGTDPVTNITTLTFTLCYGPGIRGDFRTMLSFGGAPVCVTGRADFFTIGIPPILPVPPIKSRRD